ncbi:MAG: SGNH/GDSL hydrolase family protein [Eubacteriales bacterium]|nr:SGNH/GDSL hydrolase family protein [Eubacteriales bacterium]
MKLFNNIKKKLAGFLIAACVSTAFFGSFTPVYAADRVYATADCNAAYNSTIDNWFSDTVFIGDSLMQGFRSYAALHGGSWMDRLGFLCTANFSSFNAFNSDIIQPMYMGQRTRVWEGVKLMNARRIFICLGLNDINMGSLDECIASYEKFVGRILEDNPGIEVNIISMTYAYPGVQSQNIYNPTIACLIKWQQNMAGAG